MGRVYSMNKVISKRLTEAESRLTKQTRKVVILCNWTVEELDAIRPEIGGDVELIDVVGYGNPPRPARPIEELLADYKEQEAGQ